jgi:hypothetical protein
VTLWIAVYWGCRHRLCGAISAGRWIIDVLPRHIVANANYDKAGHDTVAGRIFAIYLPLAWLGDDVMGCHGLVAAMLANTYVRSGSVACAVDLTRINVPGQTPLQKFNA